MSSSSSQLAAWQSSEGSETLSLQALTELLGEQVREPSTIERLASEAGLVLGELRIHGVSPRDAWFHMLFHAHRTKQLDGLLQVLRGHLPAFESELVAPLDWPTILPGEDGSLMPSEDRVSALCDAYVNPLRAQFIGGELKVLPGAEKLLGTDGLPVSRRVLVVGGAGGGKSSELAHLVERLRKAHVPTLPIRLDQVQENVQTLRQLGDALSLHTSPVAALAKLAGDGGGVLVVDQLDAVSLTSGRRTDLWGLFEELLTEANNYLNLRVVVACRQFDLEHDYRMRSLTAKPSTFEVVSLGSFSTEQLEVILGEQKVHPKLKQVLVVPLHLAMFFSLPTAGRDQITTRDDLFNAFCREKQDRTTVRLGRRCDFWGVVDKLADWLSEQQELSAPEHVLDNILPDARAMTSENVLVLSENRYRFFHEAFFDYAFARRFAEKKGRLLDLLTGEEQHLFRRAQVRQVLSYLRSTNLKQYLNELRSVLTSKSVRFHIKRAAFQYLSAITDPKRLEWQILQTLEASDPSLRDHVYGVVANSPGWFDVLNDAGVFDAALSSGDAMREEWAMSLLARHEVLKTCSARVATLLSKHRRRDEAWQKYLRYICQTGDVFYSPEMFSLFLELIRDGSLDGARPGFAINDTWWSILYSMAGEAPEKASEAIGTWFDRKLAQWRESISKQQPRGVDKDDEEDADTIDNDDEAPSARTSFADHINAEGLWGEIIWKASAVPLVYAKQILPRIAEFVANYAKERGDRLDIDPVWTFRGFGDGEHQFHAALLKSLACALESLASSSPDELNDLLAPYVSRSQDAVAYLVLRAWAAAPETYAEHLARYLAEDTRRLKVGYAFWSGEGGAPEVATNYRSIAAVRVASPRCSSEAFSALEEAIVKLKDKREIQYPQARGLRQLQLLAAMDQRRLGPEGRAMLAALRAKFPDVTQDAPPVRPMSFVPVGPPISAQAQEKMTDAQWLSAMERYAGVDFRHNLPTSIAGGEFQLSHELEERAKKTPGRFIALAKAMHDTLPAAYFKAIVSGVANAGPPGDSGNSAVSLAQIGELIERVHALPDKPCGRELAHLVRSWQKVDWPPFIIDIVVWYAKNDPDPTEEAWQKEASSGQPYYGGDAHLAGINSTRGAAAGAVARLLSDEHGRADALLDTIDRLAHDPSVAVRACAIEPLLVLLSTRPEQAIAWFRDCISLDPVLLATPLVGRFVYFAGRHDYAAIRPVLQQMLASTEAEVIKAAANVCCQLAFIVDGAKEDAERVRIGDAVMRGAAATVYAANVAHKEFGAACRQQLVPFFADPENEVRKNAAKAFRRVVELGTAELRELLAAFLAAEPGATAFEPVFLALEDSPVRLPDLVCRFVEASMKAFETEAGGLTRATVSIARHISKIVIRLYAHSEDDEDIRKRCLDVIDRMEAARFFGLSDELERLER